MAKEKYLEFSSNKNWNQADIYSKMKISKYLVDLDNYELIATFGTSNMMEELMMEGHINHQTLSSNAKLKAISWMRKILEMVIMNSRFALNKKGDDREKFEEYLFQLKKLKKIIPKLKKTGFDEKSKVRKVSVDEENFEKVLSFLSGIKEKILEPMNNADLIFTSVEEFNEDEYRKRIEEEFVYQG